MLVVTAKRKVLLYDSYSSPVTISSNGLYFRPKFATCKAIK